MEVFGVWGSEASSLAFSILFRLLDCTGHCPGERVGSGGGLLGRLVRAVGQGPRRRRTNRLGRGASKPRLYKNKGWKRRPFL